MPAEYASPLSEDLGLHDEQSVRAAVAAQTLAESHYLDLKRQIDKGRSANRELARDLASFAVDGGTLIVGIEEFETHLESAPQPLDGLPERIDQVAATAIDPPLRVVVEIIRSDADASVGWLLVHIPVSPTAPHMVDNRYLGRGDRTKRYLTDPEVLALHQRRASQVDDGFALLRKEFDRDPFATEGRSRPHLFLVAQPTAAPENMLSAVTESPDHGVSLAILRAGLAPNISIRLANFGRMGYGFDDMQSLDRRIRGVAWCTYSLQGGRGASVQNNDDPEPKASELEIFDDGGLRVYHSRFGDENRGTLVIMEGTAVEATRRFLGIVKAAAITANYHGGWTLALGVTGLRNHYSYVRQSTYAIGPATVSYPEATYEQVCAASFAEISEVPGQITRSLVGPLLRALGTRDHFEPAFSDEPLTTDHRPGQP